MKTLNKFLVLLPFLLFSIMQPALTYASTLPFNIEKKDNSKLEPVKTESLFGGLIGDLSGIVAPLYNWGIKIITILFVIGALMMILSAIFKHGQWQKYAQTTMLFSFLAMIMLRGMPIIVLSIKNTGDFDALLHEVLITLSDAAIYLGLISIAFSFVFRFGYQFIQHPEYHRWSKNLRSIAILMLIFSVGFPAAYGLI